MSKGPALLVAGAFPFPPTNGLTLRTSAFFRGLAALGYEAHLISFGNAEDARRVHPDLAAVAASVRVLEHELSSMTQGGQMWGRLAAIGRVAPFAISRFRSAPMRAAIAAWIEAHPNGLVIYDSPFVVANAPDPNAPHVLNTHNAEFLILERYAQLEKNPAKRLYAWLEAKKLRRWEAEAASRARAAIICSAEDAAALGAHAPRATFHVVPNVVDVPPTVPPSTDDGRTVVFTGGMDWFPNRDAVTFFAEAILPRLKKIRPDVQFVAAGRNPPPDLLERFASEPNLRFTGAVPDMSVEILRATVIVVPLRIGSGTRLKILEAGALEKAMVSTRLGAEGLDLTDGSELVLADDADDFARAVATLLDDPERRKRLGASARVRVERDFSFDALVRTLDTALASLVAR